MLNKPDEITNASSCLEGRAHLLRYALPFFVILCAAALLSFGAFLWPPALYQSFWIDWVWTDQFADQIRAGVFYPRWLPSSFGGLGAPVFYYYPPLSFYVAGLFDVAGLPTHSAVLAAFAFALWLSGMTMYQWLKDWTVHPLLASLFYMAAPYHLFDFYRRGALAETMAIAFLPLIALGLKRVSEGKGGALASLGFAALIVAHLPLGLLAAIFLIVPYALFLTGGRPAALIKLAVPIVIGAALSAIYLVPALMLEPYRDGAHLWAQAQYSPSSWGLFFTGTDVPRVFARLILGISVVLALGGAILAAKWRSIWAIYAIACCIIVVGLIPGFWSLPVIRQVQFPFRAIPFIEFGLATALALVPRREFIGAIAVIPALLLSAAFVAPHKGERRTPSIAYLAQHHPDALEYLPPGVASVDWNADWNLDMLKGRLPPPVVAGRTVEPVFYFPAWRATCQGREVRTFPDPETKLLSYEGRDCQRTLGWTPAEWIGLIVSLTGFAALILLRRRRAG